MMGYKDQIIEPDDDGLFSIGSQIKMDMLPMTRWRVPSGTRRPLLSVCQTLYRYSQTPIKCQVRPCIRTRIEGE